jgi:hypothetical protein
MARAAAPAAPAQDNSHAIETKTAELAAAKKSLEEVKPALAAANAKLADLNKRLETASAAGKQRDKLIGTRDSLEQQKTNINNKLEEAKNLLVTTAYPAPPTDRSVTFNGDARDKRPIFALGAAGAVVGVFVLAMALMSVAGRDATDVGAEEPALHESEPVERAVPVEA